MLQVHLIPEIYYDISTPRPTTHTVDTVILGAGPAGRKVARILNEEGIESIIVDPVRIPGGANLVAGAVPSKAMWAFAREYLKENRSTHIDRKKLLRDLISTIMNVIETEKSDNASKLRTLDSESGTNNKPIFINGRGKILSDLRVSVETPSDIYILKASNIVIATGSTPRTLPSLPWTPKKIVSSDNILDLDELPESLVIVGAGIVGIEYACYFQALGTQVTLINKSDGILTYTDSIIQEAIRDKLKELGVTIIHSSEVTSSQVSDNTVHLTLSSGESIITDLVLVSAGRVPQIQSLNLCEVPEFSLNNRGGPQDETMILKRGEETISLSFLGDVGNDGGIVGKALNQGHRLATAIARGGLNSFEPNKDQIPTAIYSFPPAAYVGLSEEEVKKLNLPYCIGSANFADNAMAAIDKETQGLLKLIFHKTTGALLGAHIVGSQAFEIINFATQFINQPCALEKIQHYGFAYPSLHGIYRQAAQSIFV